MELPGDDEIDSLLALMGAQIQHANASTKATNIVVKKKIKDESIRLKKKQIDEANEGENDKHTMPTRSCGDEISFAGTRLTQNCFRWPYSIDGKRLLDLGSGLLHDCKGYSCGGNGENSQREFYGSIPCQSCGKAAATHELCISSSWARAGDEDAIKTRHPLSLIFVASVIIASRNIRCVIGEYYPMVAADDYDNQKTRLRFRKAHEIELRPPLNSVPCSPDMISDALDVHTGRILALMKKMQCESFKPNHLYQRYDKRQDVHNKLGCFASISAVSDVEILQDKTSALIKAVQEYKSAVDATGGYYSAVDLVEKRLSAMASCDAVYYRCYYAAVISPVSTDNSFGSVVAAIIPHPPLYFSCPGLAWDAQDAGSESLRAFLGSCSDETDVASPDDVSKRMLKSWGLCERLMVGTNMDVAANPLLVLWQSRFLENIRHLWITRYSLEKFPMTLNQASSQNSDSNASRPKQDWQLKFHETRALSLAVSQWRDSVRDYPANFYSYAAPTKEALHVISNCLRGAEQILEAGAGTGYWSALLRLHLKYCIKKSDVDEVAQGPILFPYDAAPGSSNEYHGEIPSFTFIHQASNFSQALSASTTSGVKTVLLLCYPPPGNDMAYQALSAHISHGGRIVIYIGEWQGLTGDDKFEVLLAQEFSCNREDVVPLPFWGTDATYLTIWRKRDKESKGVISCSSAYGYCCAEYCSNRARRRCRYARCLQYCGLECYAKHTSARKATLALHMIDSTKSGDAVKFEDDNNFMDLSLISTKRESDGYEKLRKKKRKKKHRNFSGTPLS
ncbi:hypothetical protein ACHAXA_002937 [Cyclostephanos tholiformis]|uniref:Uncharacterized protein n=1 Tax=Cyclostephanos tholiformis TaxID=382380 RepID=A0ABD3RXR8_9STRA